MFIDWVVQQIHPDCGSVTAKFVATLLAETSEQSNPWPENSRLASPAAWNEESFWAKHVMGASTNYTETYIGVQLSQTRQFAFPFNMLDKVSVQMPLHAVAKLIQPANLRPQENENIWKQNWYICPWRHHYNYYQSTREVLKDVQNRAKEMLELLQQDARGQWPHGLETPLVCKLGKVVRHGVGSKTQVFLDKTKDFTRAVYFEP